MENIISNGQIILDVTGAAVSAGKGLFEKLVPHLGGMSLKLASKLLSPIADELAKPMPEITQDHIDLIKKWIPSPEKVDAILADTGISKFKTRLEEKAEGLFDKVSKVMGSPSSLNMLVNSIKDFRTRLESGSLIKEEVEKVIDLINAHVLDEEYVRPDGLSPESVIADVKRAEGVILNSDGGDRPKALAVLDRCIAKNPWTRGWFDMIRRFLIDVDEEDFLCVINPVDKSRIWFNPKGDGMFHLRVGNEDVFCTLPMMVFLLISAVPWSEKEKVIEACRLNVTTDAGEVDWRIRDGYFVFGGATTLPHDYEIAPFCPICYSLDILPEKISQADDFRNVLANFALTFCKCKPRKDFIFPEAEEALPSSEYDQSDDDFGDMLDDNPTSTWTGDVPPRPTGKWHYEPPAKKVKFDLPPPTPRKMVIGLPRPTIAKPLSKEDQKKKYDAISSFIGGNFMGTGYLSQKKNKNNY